MTARAKQDARIYLNGKFVAEGDAKVSVFDRCYLYGDGVFEGIAVWKRWPFRLDAHLARLERGLAYLQIKCDQSRDDWRALIHEAVAQNDMEDGYLRLQVSRGEGISSIKWERRLLKRPEPNVILIPIPGFMTYYGELFRRKAEQGYRATIVSRPRISAASVPAGIKHCNYLNSVLGAMEVTAGEYDVGIAVDRDGFVTEGLAYNIFIVRGETVITPPTTRDLLPGITREVVLEVARRHGYQAIEADFDVLALSSADEAFICSTLELAVPVVEVAGRAVGNGKPGPVTSRISELLFAEMEREAAEAGHERAALRLRG